MSNAITNYRQGNGDSSMDSIESQSSGDTADSLSGVGCGTETLPCGNREVQPLPPTTQPPVSTTTPSSNDDPPQSTGYHWTLSNWGAAQARRRNTTVRVDLASPEDISLDTDSTRVVFSAYGTTV